MGDFADAEHSRDHSAKIFGVNNYTETKANCVQSVTDPEGMNEMYISGGSVSESTDELRQHTCGNSKKPGR